MSSDVDSLNGCSFPHELGLWIRDHCVEVVVVVVVVYIF